MIVAGLQTDIAWEDPVTNFERAAGLAAGAASRGARLLALPEMFATGFSMDARRISAHAEATRSFLAELALRHGVWVVAGLAEPAPDRPRNACVVVAPDGCEVLRYHKIHPFSLAGEDRAYEAGTTVETVTVEGIRVTPLICYDLRFPELFRPVAWRTDLFIVIANWPGARVHAWRTLLVARAIENQAYVLGVNRVGEGDGLRYPGFTAVVDPGGKTIGTASGEVGAVAGEVSVERVASLRERFRFLADRRPDLYAALERPASCDLTTRTRPAGASR
jgi:predicted amidohydrolase